MQNLIKPQRNASLDFYLSWWFVFYYFAVNLAIMVVCVLIDKLVTILNNKEVQFAKFIYAKIFNRKKVARCQQETENPESPPTDQQE